MEQIAMPDGYQPSNELQQRLYRYIMDYHPYMEEDNKQEMIAFIVQRAQSAKSAYKNASDEGKDGIQCLGAANEVLYAGLEFSPITYLIEVCVDTKGYEMDKKEACEIYRNPEVRAIFDKYPRDIEGDDKESLLVEELIPFLNKYEGKGEGVDYKHIDVF